MRFAVLVFGSLLFAATSYATDMDELNSSDSIDQQKEEGLEADTTAMEIHDLESEQKLAREQTRAQEQMKAAAEQHLKKVQSQKANVSQKLKIDIMLSEARRKKAEAETAVLKKQIQQVQSEIKVLEASRDKAEKAASDAKGIAEAGREALHDLKLKKAQVSEQNQKAQINNKKAQKDLSDLRAEAAHMKTHVTASNSK